MCLGWSDCRMDERRLFTFSSRESMSAGLESGGSGLLKVIFQNLSNLDSVRYGFKLRMILAFTPVFSHVNIPIIFSWIRLL